MFMLTGYDAAIGGEENDSPANDGRFLAADHLRGISAILSLDLDCSRGIPDDNDASFTKGHAHDNVHALTALDGAATVPAASMAIYAMRGGGHFDVAASPPMYAKTDFTLGTWTNEDSEATSEPVAAG